MIPELSVFDINQTVAFYKKIGLQIIYERPEDLFVFMSFAENQFMFEQIHDKGWNTGKMLYPLGHSAKRIFSTRSQRLLAKIYKLTRLL